MYQEGRFGRPLEEWIIAQELWNHDESYLLLRHAGVKLQQIDHPERAAQLVPALKSQFSSSSSSSSCLSSASMDAQPSSMAGRAPGRAALRGNRKRVFAGIGLGIGSLGSGTGSGLSRKLRQYRIGESAQRFVGVMRELKLRA